MTSMQGANQTNLPPSLPPRWCEQNSKSHNHSARRREEPLVTKNMTNQRKTFFIIRSSSAFLVAQNLLGVKSNLGDIKVGIARTESILKKLQNTNTDLVQQAQSVIEYAQNMKEVNKKKVKDSEAKMASMKEYQHIKEKMNMSCSSTTAMKTNGRTGNENYFLGNQFNKYNMPNSLAANMTNVNYSSQASPVINETNAHVLPVQAMTTSSTNLYTQQPHYNHLGTENNTIFNPDKAYSYQNKMNTMYGANLSSKPYQPL